jgi:hypothetical protein
MEKLEEVFYLTDFDNLKENTEHLIEMSMFDQEDTGLPVAIWIDDSGFSRNVKHNLPRLKFQPKGKSVKSLVPISISENPRVLLKHYTPTKEETAVKEFIIHNRDLLLDLYSKKFRTRAFYDKMRIKGYYSLSNILELIKDDIKQVISENQIRQDFAAQINLASRRKAGLLDDRMSKKEAVSFLANYYGSSEIAEHIINEYDEKDF